MPDIEGFKVVTRRKKCGSSVRNSRSATLASFRQTEEDKNNDIDVDCEILLRKLHGAETKVNVSTLAHDVFAALEESLGTLKLDGISDIVCYGLGSFSWNRSSRYQLALLLSMKRRYGSCAYIYDPIFLPEEVELLKKFGFKVLEINEEGKRIVRDASTLIYMPHCSTHLVNNFLYANWGPKLVNCILVTNSFSVVVDYPKRTNLCPRVDYLLRIRPYVTEIPLRNGFEHEEAFNDTSIHIFLERDIAKVAPAFWTTKEEPRYCDADVEFLTAERTKNRTVRTMSQEPMD